MLVLVSLKNLQDAQRVVAFLSERGVACEIEEFEAVFQVVLVQENDLDKATSLLAGVLRPAQGRTALSWARLRAIPFTLLICALVLLVFFLEYVFGQEVALAFLSYSAGTQLSGHFAFWRVLTPVFLHFSVLHVVFNVLWWWQWGGMIERWQSSWRLLAVFVVSGCLSNMMQFYFSGPNFGGLSGVVYGLMGYLWLYKKLRPASPLFVQPQIVNALLIWMLLGFSGLLTPLIGPMANWAHGFGLVAGCGLGLLCALLDRSKSVLR